MSGVIRRRAGNAIAGVAVDDYRLSIPAALIGYIESRKETRAIAIASDYGIWSGYFRLAYNTVDYRSQQ